MTCIEHYWKFLILRIETIDITRKERTMGDHEDVELGDVWTDDFENILKAWGEEARGLAILHGQCQTWFKGWDLAISIPSIVIAAIAALAILQACQFVLQIIYAVILASSAALAGIAKYLNYDSRSTRHAEAQKDFQLFANDIEDELALSRNLRQKCHKFFRRMQNQRRVLTRKDYPAIIDYYISKYKRKLRSRDISHPAILGDINEIPVNKSEDPDNVRATTTEVRHVIDEEKSNPRIIYELERNHE